MIEPRVREHIIMGSGAPSSTPSYIGQKYIDTTGKRTYIAMGTSSSSDWQKQPIFASGTVTVTAGGGDVTVDLGFDWSNGYLITHQSDNTSKYYQDSGSIAYKFETSYIALTDAGYTTQQDAYLFHVNGNGVALKTTNQTGFPKSATSTSFTLDDDGATSKYIKWFVWA